MKAVYNLGKSIAGFDFFTWLVMQKESGVTSVSFDTNRPKSQKFSPAEIMQRYQSILKPGCALAGLTYDELGSGNVTQGGQVALVNHCNAGGTFPRLKSVLPPGKERYTVTLRNTKRWPHRNSREEVWREFSAEIGALVIPDYDIEPIDLHERMALYAGAEMNFFVSNGPVILCFLSDYPAMSFDVGQSPLINLGIPMGGQYPFLLSNHRQIYEPDTSETIRKHFYHWRDEGKFL